jgi:hypothetical protein
VRPPPQLTPPPSTPVQNRSEMSAQELKVRAILDEIDRKGGSMEERFYRSEHRTKSTQDIEELAKNAPVWRKPGDLACPEIFPDDAEYEEFLAWIRTERQRHLI